MKIAIPLLENSGLSSRISPHFGRAPYFAFVEVRGGKVYGVEIVENPGVEHSPGEIPMWMKERGVDLVIACNIGPRALNFFRQLGIEVTKGQCGTLKDALEALGIDT